MKEPYNINPISGECCYPWDSIKKECGEARLPETYVGFYKEEHAPGFDNPWKPIVGDK